MDLRVVSPDGAVTNMPWVLDPLNPTNEATTGDNFRDNVEMVHIDAPTNGWYTVCVTHKGTLSNDVQDVSIVVTGNMPTNAPALSVVDFYVDGTNVNREIEWPAVVGGLYRIKTKTDLMDTNDWTVCENAISASHEVMSWSDAAYQGATNEAGFYRVVRLR